MSMTMLTVLQATGVSAAYLAVTLLLPFLFLHKKLHGFANVPIRFMIYFMAGNFYVMNLVFLLELLHLSFRLTLILGTLAPFIAEFVRKHKGSFRLYLERGIEKLSLLAGKEMGRKTFLMKLGVKLKKMSSGRMGMKMSGHWMDVLLTGTVIVLVLYMYGLNTVHVYGYCASDLVLHNYWINEMNSNHIFADGVYPFGFHCVVYYLHAVFAIPVYVVLRVFCLVQTVMIHLMLLAFLKTVCRARYTPYIGTVVYILSDVFYQYAYYRYYASLPQEFGMLFILPAACFAVAFLRERDFTAAAGREEKGLKAVNLYLIMFAASISMTLAAHFYDTIIAGLLCVGIGAGFCFRCFRWRYLKRIVTAGIAGLMIAVLPMAAAYVTGTPLQGSLNWGMAMLSSGSQDSGGADSKDADDGGKKAEKADKADSSKNFLARAAGMFTPKKTARILERIDYYVMNDNIMAVKILLGSIAAAFLLGLLWMLFRKAEYGAVLISLSIFTGLLAMLQVSEVLGLPQLMEVTRYPVYLVYGIVAVWSLCLDAVILSLCRWPKAMNVLSMAGLIAACVVVAETGIRSPRYITAYETNEAITCLTDILHDNRDNVSWTICSANDERQMIGDKGYHYEMITFLRKMQSVNKNTEVTIPTDTVYFFIEKVPLYYRDYINSEIPKRKVSLAGARKPLSDKGGILPYIEDARWVTMSHMYYWAQAFKELYPNEMEVYMETDRFVCYRLRQNGYSLYNFAIDYGYNGND